MHSYLKRDICDTGPHLDKAQRFVELLSYNVHIIDTSVFTDKKPERLCTEMIYTIIGKSQRSNHKGTDGSLLPYKSIIDKIPSK